MKGRGSVMVWRMISTAGAGHSYAATLQSECKWLSATCSSFPAFISQSACNFHAGQYCRHTAQWVKQFLKAENIEIMKRPGPESWSKSYWKSLVKKLWLRNPQQSPNCGREWKKSGPRLHQIWSACFPQIKRYLLKCLGYFFKHCSSSMV